jgi:hypothetical protein
MNEIKTEFIAKRIYIYLDDKVICIVNDYQSDCPKIMFPLPLEITQIKHLLILIESLLLNIPISKNNE